MTEKKNAYRQTKAFRLFLDELTGQVRVMEQLIAQNCCSDEEYAALREQFHKIKGTSGMFGFENIGSVAAEIEERLKERRLQISDLQLELARYRLALHAIIEEPLV